MGLQDKVVIVTGSGTGIGAATALQVARLGGCVVVNCSRNVEAAEATAAACRDGGGQAIVVRANVAQDTDCIRLAQSALDAWGRIDALVNNAGTTKFCAMKDLDGLDAADFHAIYGVNLIGAFQMMRACAPALRDSGGAVVNVSSVASTEGTGSSIAYSCSKGALNTLTLSMAKVMGPQVRVNAVLPGMIDSSWLRAGLGAELFDRIAADYRSRSALQDTVLPDEVAQCIVALLQMPKTTGQLLAVEAGRRLGPAPMVKLPAGS